MKKTLVALAAVLGLGAGYALAQTLYVPQVPNVGATDLFQDVVGGVPGPGETDRPGAPDETRPDNGKFAHDFSVKDGRLLWSFGRRDILSDKSMA